MEEQCVETEQFCAETGKECRRYETVCQEEVEYCQQYQWVKEGQFCKDPGPNFGSCCSGCAGAERISQTMGQVLKTSFELEQESFRGDGAARNMELLSILDIILENMEFIKTKIQRFTTESTSQNNEESTTEKPHDENHTEQVPEICSGDCDILYHHHPQGINRRRSQMI